MSFTTPSHRLAGAAMALLLLGGAAACGTSSSDGAADGTTTTTSADADAENSTETTDLTDDSEDETTSTTEESRDPVSGGSREDYVDALASTFTEEDGEIYTSDQVQCMAEHFVDTIGVDGFEQAGVTPEMAADDGVMDELEIDEPTAREMAGAFASCDVNIREIFLEQLSAGQEMTAEQRACVEGVLTDDAIVESFVIDITGDETTEDPFDAIMPCMTGTTDGSSGG